MMDNLLVAGTFRLLIASMCLLISACAELREQGKQRIRGDVNQHIAENKDKVTPADIQSCISKRSDLPNRSSIIGKPTYKPIPFLTCIALYNSTAAELFQRGQYMVYEVRLTTESNASEQPDKTIVSQSQFYCLFRVTEEGIKSYPPGARDGVFDGIVVPDRITVNHPCLAIPDANKYLGPLVNSRR